MKQRIIATAVLFLAASGVLAEPGGEATVSLDGIEYTATLNAEQSDWSGDADTRGSISMSLRTTDRDVVTDFAGLSLGLEFANTSVQHVELNILRIPESGLERLYSDVSEDRGSLVVKIEAISGEGSELSLSGTISGSLGQSENFGRDIDFGEPVSLEAAFAVRLEKLAR